MQVMQDVTQVTGTILGDQVVIPAGARVDMFAGVHLRPENGPYFLIVQEMTAVPVLNPAPTQARGVAVVSYGSGGGRFDEEFDVGIGRTFPINGVNFALSIRNEGTVTARYSGAIMRGSTGQSVFTRTTILGDVVATNAAFSENTIFPIPPFACQVQVCPDSRSFPPGIRFAFLTPALAVVGPVFDVGPASTDNPNLVPVPAGAVFVAFNGGADFAGGALVWRLAS